MNEVEKHPAYATIRFSKLYGGKDIPLFGSNIKHANIIRMELRHAEEIRVLNGDKIYGSKPIITVDMSYSQFAEAISSFDLFEGVPCTLRYTEKDGCIEPPQFKSKTEIFENEFSEHLQSFEDDGEELMSKIEDILNKKSIGKADKDELVKMVSKYITNVTDNSEFIYERFNESMDKTVTQAKNEVEAFTQNRLDSIAKQVLLSTVKNKEDSN